MKVLIDTNVILDILEHRKPYFQNSYKIIQLGLEGKFETMFSAGAATDVYYIIKKSTRNADLAKEKIIALGGIVNLCDTTAADITAALALNMIDFEDAVVAAIAKREKADFIITRNEDDFANSPVPAVSPARFLKQYMDSKEEQ
ncbi:MAG: PIN domain-containing protein [Treponema sp.]|nr:PIN domain-containing protein [Treponema sp.]